MRLHHRAHWAVLLAALAAAPAAGQETDPLPAQKAAAEATWKKLALPQGGLTESEHLLVYSPLAKDKAAALAESLEKQYAVAVKALKFDANQQPWQGKLALFVLPERAAFTSFARTVIKESPRPTEAGFSDVSPPTPTAVAGVAADTAGRVAVARQAGLQLAQAVLKARAGRTAAVPEWVREGFAWAVLARTTPADPEATRIRARVRALAPRVSPKEAWGTTLTGDALTAVQYSFAEYLAFSKADGAKFPSFLSAFRPGENEEVATIDKALDSANVDWASAERNWKRFVVSGQ